MYYTVYSARLKKYTGILARINNLVGSLEMRKDGFYLTGLKDVSGDARMVDGEYRIKDEDEFDILHRKRMITSFRYRGSRRRKNFIDNSKESRMNKV